MLLSDILKPSCTISGARGNSKKRILDFCAKTIQKHHPELDSTLIFDGLVAREKLGSTGMGLGIAIPHCRLNACSQTLGVLLKLDDTVDFDSIDGQKVDLVFALLVPEEGIEEHLHTLQHLASLFKEESFCEALRHSNTSTELYKHAIESEKLLLTRLAS